MSKDNPQPHHRPANDNQPLAELRSIPVAEMQFRDLFEVPNSITSTGLRSETQTNKKRHVITYLPQIQHFQIQIYKPDATKPDRTVMVWIGHVNWWAAAA